MRARLNKRPQGAGSPARARPMQWRRAAQARGEQKARRASSQAPQRESAEHPRSVRARCARPSRRSAWTGRFSSRADPGGVRVEHGCSARCLRASPPLTRIADRRVRPQDPFPIVRIAAPRLLAPGGARCGVLQALASALADSLKAPVDDRVGAPREAQPRRPDHRPPTTCRGRTAKRAAANDAPTTAHRRSRS